MLPKLDRWLDLRKEFKFEVPTILPELQSVIDEITKTNECIIYGPSLLFSLFGRPWDGYIMLLVLDCTKEKKDRIVERLTRARRHRNLQEYSEDAYGQRMHSITSLGCVYVDYLYRTPIPREEWPTNIALRVLNEGWRNPTCKKEHLLNVVIDFLPVQSVEEVLSCMSIASEKVLLSMPDKKLHFQPDFVKFLVAGDVTIGLKKTINTQTAPVAGNDSDQLDQLEIAGYNTRLMYIHPVMGVVNAIVEDTSDMIKSDFYSHDGDYGILKIGHYIGHTRSRGYKLEETAIGG